MQRERKAGLAIPEYLFLLSVWLMMLAVIIPAVLDWQKYQRIRRTYSEVRILVSAAEQFNREYRLWPMDDAPSRKDVRFGQTRSNGGVFNILSAQDAEGNAHHTANPMRFDFFALVEGDARQFRRNQRGDVLDPWGRPYQMVFDANYDNICEIEGSAYSAVAGTGVLIWSVGPDGESDTKDDIRSWMN